jgi:pyruvate/2-oxoglutarate dehydrogenase complex dihydrolipoamide acyltransferase (E2) component
MKVNFPKSGMGIEEGTLVRWLRGQGEPVTKGEVIAEIETAKALQEIVAPASGVLTKILTIEGETVPVNSPIAEIE